METALNLCDLIPSTNYCFPFLASIVKGTLRSCRVYIGSYFCVNKFLSLKTKEGILLLNYLLEKSIKTSLVLPIATQKNWDSMIELVDSLLERYKGIIDEIIVNDLGTLSFLHRKYSTEIVLGRMFNKTCRDIRNEHYFLCAQSPKFFNKFYDTLIGEYGIKKIELDNGLRETSIPMEYQDFLFCVHSPLCYVTKCNICEFASIHKSIEHKFRASDKCGLECLNNYIEYENSNKNNLVRHYKIGCGVYYINECLGVATKHMRIIENPFLEVMKNESFSPIE